MPQRLKLKEHQQLPYLTVLRKMWFILPILKVGYSKMRDRKRPVMYLKARLSARDWLPRLSA